MFDHLPLTPLPAVLEQRCKAIIQTTHKIFSDRGKLLPTFFLMLDDGSTEIIGTDMTTENQKDMMAAILKKLGHDRKAIAIMHVAESWMADTNAFKEHMHIDVDKAVVPKKQASEMLSSLTMDLYYFYKKFYGSIEKMPWSREAVFVSVESVWGSWLMAMDIDRSGSGPRLREPEGWHKPEEGAWSGRFADLLEKPTFPPDEKTPKKVA